MNRLLAFVPFVLWLLSAALHAQAVMHPSALHAHFAYHGFSGFSAVAMIAILNRLSGRNHSVHAFSVHAAHRHLQPLQAWLACALLLFSLVLLAGACLADFDPRRRLKACWLVVWACPAVVCLCVHCQDRNKTA